MADCEMWTFDDENLADANEAIELARTVSSPAAEATARGLLGAGLFLRGRWDEAEVELRKAAGQPTTVFEALGAGPDADAVRSAMWATARL
jgi:hypothetical protein